MNSQDMDMFQKALNISFLNHKSQKRKDGSPYFGHLMAVSTLVMQFGQDFNGYNKAIIVALLHDIIEDTSFSKHELSIFGEDITQMVMSLTEDKSISEWKERKTNYFKSILNSRELCMDLQLDSRLVAFVSLCDKYHNLSCHLDTKLQSHSNNNYYRDVWFYMKMNQIFSKFFTKDFYLYKLYVDKLLKFLH